MMVLVPMILSLGFVYFLIQININPVGKLPAAYVVKGPIAIDIGASYPVP